MIPRILCALLGHRWFHRTHPPAGWVTLATCQRCNLMKWGDR